MQRAQARTNRRLRALLAGVAVAARRRAGRGRPGARPRRRAAASRRDAADVSRVAAVSRSVVERQPDLGLLLAAAAFDLDDTADTRATLLQRGRGPPAARRADLRRRVRARGGGLLARRHAAGHADLGRHRHDPLGHATHRRLDVLRRSDGDISLDAAISPDGRWLVVPASTGGRRGGYEATLQVWDLEDRTPRDRRREPGRRAHVRVVQRRRARGWSPRAASGLGPGPGRGRRLGHVDVGAGRRSVGAGRRVLRGRRLRRERRGGAWPRAPFPTPRSAIWRIADRTAVGRPDRRRPTHGRRGRPVHRAGLCPGRRRSLAISTDVGGRVPRRPGHGLGDGSPVEVPESTATALEFSPDGDLLAVGRLDGRTQLYDVAPASRSARPSPPAPPRSPT